MYVTEAQNPVKETHEPILKYVLRDLGKLKNTIFVINKMDEVCELSDEDLYQKSAEIKKKNLISRLENAITFSPEEKKNLKICCVSSNPNNRGLDFWFKHEDKYLKRSKINLLREEISNIYNSIDKDKEIEGSSESVVKDLLKSFISEYAVFRNKATKQLKSAKEILDETEIKLSDLRKIIMDNRRLLGDELRVMQETILQKIDNSSMDTFQSVVNANIGDDGNKLINSIQELLSQYCEQNNADIKKAGIIKNFEELDKLTSAVLKTGASFLKNVKLSADTIKSIRNVVASGFKFKPWGAIKFAKWASMAIIALGFIIDGILWLKSHEQQKKFQKAKNDVKKFVTDSFNHVSELLHPDETYIENFAPALINIQEVCSSYEKTVSGLSDNLNDAEMSFNALEKWYGKSLDGINTEDIIY